MKMLTLGLSGIQVGEVCLGAMNFGNPRIGVGETESREVIAAYLDAGGNFIDTADAYGAGRSEEIVGKAIAGRRDAVVLATKGFFPRVASPGDPPAHANALGSSRRHLRSAIEASLRRLGTDFVDLYQVHCWDDDTPIEETMSTLDDLVREGKTRYVGLSNFTAWQIAESRMLAKLHGWEPFVTAQMQYSLVCRWIEQDVIPACRRYGIGLLPWSPLGGGVLTGKYASPSSRDAPGGTRYSGEPPTEANRQWRARFLNDRNLAVAASVRDIAAKMGSSATAVSIAWLLGREGVTSVIIGPKTVAQLADNLAGAALAIPAEDRRALDAASAPPERYPEWFIAAGPRATR